MQYSASNEQETKAIAQQFADRLKGGEVVALKGDLGAGKTTFVQGVVQALGVEGRIKSPTYSLLHEYGIQGHEIQHVYHMDLYRLTSDEDVRNLSLEDLHLDQSVLFIEWPDRVETNMPFTHEILFEHVGAGRSIEIRKL